MKLFFTHKPLAMQNNRIVAESYQKLIRRNERIRKTVGITGFFGFFELFPLSNNKVTNADFQYNNVAVQKNADGSYSLIAPTYRRY